MVILISVRGCGGSFSDFKGVSKSCQSSYRSAWGHPEARRYALRLLRDSDSCPPVKKIGIRSQAAYIGANLNPSPINNPCHDKELFDRLLEICGTQFPSDFKSTLWHAHADGHRQFGDHVHVELGLLVVISALLLLATISAACMQLVVRHAVKRTQKGFVRPAL